MYASFFGLGCLPFEDRADPQFFFTTSESEEALAAMEYEAHYGKGLGLVLGASGTGKTLLIRTLLSRLNSNDRAVIITWLANGALDLIRECCKGFGVTLGSSPNPARRLNRLRRHLQRAVAADQRPILILDQAENLTPDNMGELATLGDLQGDHGKLLTIILVGQPQFRSLMDKPELSRLKQRLYGDRTLSPLPLSDTQEYIRHRLRVAGTSDPELFGLQAVARIHEASGGIPRLINNICNAVMVAAYGAETTEISDVLVEEVTRRSTHSVRTMDARDVGVEHAGQVASGWPEALAHHAAVIGGRETATASCGVASGRTVSAGVGGACGVPAPGPGNGGAFGMMSDRAAAAGDPPLGSPAFGGGGLVEGEMLYDRLEQALARADRMSSTTEATLAQFTAVEKYLASLLDRAERIVGGLQPSIQQGTQVLDQTQVRLAEILADAERRTAAIETRMRQTAELMNDSGEQVKRIEQVRARAESVESRLTSVAERIADKADEVQGHVTVLMKNVELSESARTEFGALVDQAMTVTENADGRIDALRVKMKECLDESERSGRETVESLRSKLDGMAAQAASSATESEGRMQVLTGKLESVAESTKRFEKQVMESTVERVRRELSEQIETLVRSQKEALDEAVADANARVQASIDSAVEQVNRTRRKFEEDQRSRQETLDVAMAQRGRELTAALEESAVAFDRTRTQLEANHESLQEKLDSAIADNGERLQASIRKAEQSVERIHAQFEEKQCSWQEKLDSATSENDATLQASITKAEQGAERTYARLEETQCSVQEKLERAIAESGGKIEALTTAARQRTEELRRGLDGAERRNSEMRASLTHLTAGTDEAAARLNELQDTLGGVHSTVIELTERSESITGPLASNLDRGESMIRDAGAACEEMKTLQNLVAAGLVEVGMGCEKVSAARQQVEECERITAGLTHDTIAGQKIADELRGVTASGEKVLQQVEGRADEVRGNLEKLEARSASVDGLLERLDEATATGHMVIDRATASSLAAEQAAREAHEQTERLSYAGASGGKAAERLDAVVESAGQIHEALTGLVAHADEKIGRISSHHAAASQIVDRLSKANVTAHEAIEQLETSRQAVVEEVEAANTKVDQILLDVSAITENTEENCRELSVRNAEATGLLERLEGSTEPASRISADLSKSTEEADRVAARIAEDCEKASSLAERLNTVSRVLSAAKTIGTSVQRTVDQAKELSGKLQSVTERAGKQCATLQSIEEKSQGMVEMQKQLAAGTEEAINKFADQLASTETGEQLVNELLGQVESLGREVYELQRRANEAEARIVEATAVPKEVFDNAQAQAAQIEQDLRQLATQAETRIREATSTPREVVKNAQAQAAQLEQVCAAVRRVFAGLSKASLEAKRQTDQLHGAGAEATGRLEQLSSETNRASRTLNQWVQEAIQAQSRLEQTLGECPSINDTHPSDSLRSVARTVGSLPRVANPSAGGQLTMLSDPGEDASAGRETLPGAADGAVAKPATRAEEISRLIKEAKQARKDAKHDKAAPAAKAEPVAQA